MTEPKTFSYRTQGRPRVASGTRPQPHNCTSWKQASRFHTPLRMSGMGELPGSGVRAGRSGIVKGFGAPSSQHRIAPPFRPGRARDDGGNPDSTMSVIWARAVLPSVAGGPGRD